MVVVLRGDQGRMVLRFRSAERAVAARLALYAGPDALVEDDCGAALRVDCTQVCAVLVSEMAAELAANADAAMLSARGQADLDERSAADPKIEVARRRAAIRQRGVMVSAAEGGTRQ